MKIWLITIIVGTAIICAGPLLDNTDESSPKDENPYCTELGGPNAGHVIKDGVMVCTDKRGNKIGVKP